MNTNKQFRGEDGLLYTYNAQNQKVRYYTLKEKYEYYKNKANSDNSKNKQGKKIGFTGRVALANNANRIKSRMGKNKRNYDYYKD